MEISPAAMKTIIAWYTLSSLFLFILYGLDKRQAVIGGRRISERTLHLVAFAGGFPGGFLGRWLFHHKTRKPVFLILLLISAVCHALLWVIMYKMY